MGAVLVLAVVGTTWQSRSSVCLTHSPEYYIWDYCTWDQENCPKNIHCQEAKCWYRMILNNSVSFGHLALAINIFSCIRHLVPDYMDISRVRDHLCLLASVKLISHTCFIPPVNTSIISKGPWTLEPSVCSIWVCFSLICFIFGVLPQL